MAAQPDDHDNADEQHASYTQSANNHDHIVNFRLNSAGEAGSRIGTVLLTHFDDANIIDVEESPVGDTSLTVPANPAVDFDAHLADVDFQISEELRVVLHNNPELREFILDERLLTIIGGGGGKEYRRVERWFDEYPALDDHLEAAVTADPVPHITLDIAGATGATGAAHVRRHIDRIQDGDLPSPADHAGIYLPVFVGPALRLTDQYVQAISSDHERRAFESQFDHREVLRNARADGAISGDIYADNALLSVLGRINTDHIPIDVLRDLHLPVRQDDDWGEVIDAIQHQGHYDVSNAVANDALIRSLLPALYTGIRPEGVHFDQGDSVFDRADLGGHLTGCTWIPGVALFDDLADVGAVVPEHGQPDSISQALYPAAQYAAYTTAAGFNFDNTQRCLVFIHADGAELDGQDHGLVRRTIADELGIHAADVATVEIDGLDGRHFLGDDDPDLGISVLVGVDEIASTYRALGAQTL